MIKRFPGFIDVHVHLREPGAIHKENFLVGSKAAIRGGFTYIIDMPNNPISTVTPERLEEKILLSKKAVCSVGFHYGTDGKNIDTFSHVWSKSSVFGLKIYCNHTTGDLLVENKDVLEKIFDAWNSEKPILVHAEKETLNHVLELAKKYKRRLHVCHVSRKVEVDMIHSAKNTNQWVSAGVTPHHLFLTDKDREHLGNLALMKPELGNQMDQDALWEGIGDGTIDLVETDHAPHTLSEKQSEKPPFGVPGLETAVGLLFKAVHEKKLTEGKIVELLYKNPQRLFHLPEELNTYIELDPQKSYRVENKDLVTKCGWSPFENWELFGKIETVVFKNKSILNSGFLVTN